jgi:hypothetical protein
MTVTLLTEHIFQPQKQTLITEYGVFIWYKLTDESLINSFLETTKQNVLFNPNH